MLYTRQSFSLSGGEVRVKEVFRLGRKYVGISTIFGGKSTTQKTHPQWWTCS